MKRLTTAAGLLLATTTGLAWAQSLTGSDPASSGAGHNASPRAQSAHHGLTKPRALALRHRQR
jgi:hypothetical protein